MLLRNRQIRAWSLYELAETALHALYFTFFWPLYIQEHLGGSEFQIGLSTSLSLLAVALIVPLVGAFSDAWGRRTPILLVSTILTAVTVALTGYTGLIGALLLGAAARILLSIDDDLYSAKLPDVAAKNQIGQVSGLGVGVGYFGTILALLAAYPILEMLGWDTLAATRAMFWQAAAFLIVFSLPLFLIVKDPPRQGQAVRIAFWPLLQAAFNEVKVTLVSFKRFKALPRFLLASFIYNDAVHTTLIFLVLFSREVIGVSIQQFLLAFGIMAVGAAFGSLIFGRLSDRYGPKRSLTIALIGWILVVVYLLLDPSFTDLIIAGTVGGAMLGGVWTMNRHLMISLAPARKMGELLGVEGFTRRSAGVIGAVSFGAIVTWFGYTPGLIFIIFLFVAGLLLLQLVPFIPSERLNEGRLDL